MCRQLQENRQDVADGARFGVGLSDPIPLISERAIRMGSALWGNTVFTRRLLLPCTTG